MALFQNKKQQQQVIYPDHQLTRAEIEVVLRLLASTTFPVKDIEVLYSALIKLQEQFKEHGKDEP